MWRVVYLFLFYFQDGRAFLWPKGVVHFAINHMDYDVHSQDIIQSTLNEMEREICVKFFKIPSEFNSSERPVLYVSNPGKRKACPPDKYNFSQTVVDMPIGYKCIDKKNIARIVVDMLRAGIENLELRSNSFVLTRTFQEMQEAEGSSFLMNPSDRNYINAHYHGECRSLSVRVPLKVLRSAQSDDETELGPITLSEENKQYYKDKLWPLGILTYELDKDFEGTVEANRLKAAITTIEVGSCVVFQEVHSCDAILPKNMLLFTKTGVDAPALGFKEGIQNISLTEMVTGVRGHPAHIMNLLMRALGLPMASNRPDRDNHLNIHWKNVANGKEHYLEQYPMEAWVRHSRLPYDFESVTHAPANYACQVCRLGKTTVEPAHDHLWSRTMSIGRYINLSEGDKLLLEAIYSQPCSMRYITGDNNQ